MCSKHLQVIDRFGQSRKRETQIDSDDKRSSEKNAGKTYLEKQISKNILITAKF